jgi:hypothetical protein
VTITPLAAEFLFANGKTYARDVAYDFSERDISLQTARVVTAQDMSILFPQVL